MRKIVLTLAAAAMSFSLSAQSAFVLNGSIDEKFEGKMLYLTPHAQRIHLDSTIVKNGTFTFKGNIDIPQFVTFEYQGDKKWLESFGTVFLEEGTITFKDGKATGTPVNEKWNAYQEEIRPYNLEKRKYQTEYQKIAADYMKAEKEKQPIDTLKIRAQIAELEKNFNVPQAKLVEITQKYIQANLDNTSPNDLILFYEDNYTLEEAETLIAQASANLKQMPSWKVFIQRTEGKKRSGIGKKFTDFTMQDLEGNKVSLSDYVNQGKYVFLDVWAAWCRPCRMEIPAVKAAYAKFKDKGFEVVSVSLDETLDTWKKVVAYEGLTWPQMSDLKGWKSEVVKLYGIKGIPFTLLIAPDGTIVAQNLRGDEIEKRLSQFLK